MYSVGPPHRTLLWAWFTQRKISLKPVIERSHPYLISGVDEVTGWVRGIGKLRQRDRLPRPGTWVALISGPGTGWLTASSAYSLVYDTPNYGDARQRLRWFIQWDSGPGGEVTRLRYYVIWTMPPHTHTCAPASAPVGCTQPRVTIDVPLPQL